VLAASDTPIGETLARLGRHGIRAAVLVPTETGLKKSILDAIGPLRDYLREAGVHDYLGQAQGVEAKRLVRAVYVYAGRERQTVASLYRPRSKQGDPRIWFRGLGSYARAHNLLVIVALRGTLHVINCSDKAIIESLDVDGSPLQRLALAFSQGMSPSAAKLLGKLKKICAQGFVPSIRVGDTGIGATLEDLLGIATNTRRTPDYEGIEVKASRRLPRGANRITLFSQVPDWKRSALDTAGKILEAYGYQREARRQLYCTVSAKPNAQGLFFRVREDEGLLRNKWTDGQVSRDVVCWALETLKGRLKEKHPETMWVKAAHQLDERGREWFHYKAVVHTRNPFVENWESLVSDSTITMDYTLSMRAHGTTRDHGYLFKIHPDMITALFPPPMEHDLSK